MRVLRASLRAAAAASLCGLALSQQSAAQSVLLGIGHAKDGDSLTVGSREVRLFGIDAPEWDQSCTRAGREWSCGAVAAEELALLVTGKDVSCLARDTDRYGRTVAQCSVGDTDVNRTMVALGYAVAYRRYSSAYVSAEESARAHRRGLWAGTFEMPSLYRRDERGGVAEPAPRRSHVPKTRQAASVPDTGCIIKGNRGSHGWIYHLPGMPYYDRTRPEEWFCTEAQAQAAGYRRARAR